MEKSGSKNVLAVVFGSVTGIGLIWMGKYLMPLVFPMLKGIDDNDHAAFANAIAHMPVNGFLCILLVNILASFAGGVVATVVSNGKNAWLPLMVGGLLTLLDALKVFVVPHPVWFTITSLLVYLPIAYVGFVAAKWQMNRSL